MKRQRWMGRGVDRKTDKWQIKMSEGECGTNIAMEAFSYSANHLHSAWQILCMCRLVAHTHTHKHRRDMQRNAAAKWQKCILQTLIYCMHMQLTHSHNGVTDRGTSSHYRTGLPLLSHRRGSPARRCPRTSWSDAANPSHMSYCRDSSGSSCPSYLHLGRGKEKGRQSGKNIRIVNCTICNSKAAASKPLPLFSSGSQIKAMRAHSETRAH